MRIKSPGHALLAVTMIGLGVLGLIQGNFTAVWGPVPDWLVVQKVLPWLCSLVSLACGLGLLWPRSAAPASRVLLAVLLLWVLLVRSSDFVPAPLVILSWEDTAETAVMAAGAWVLYAWFAGDWDRRRLGFACGESGLRIARMLYGLAMIEFGLAHFAVLDQTAPLVPAWLPGHVAWACFTGGAYIAAGLGLLSGVLARLAATLSVAQMGLFTVLVWVPIVSGPNPSAFDWSEICASWALTAAGWVVADSYRGMPWLAAGRWFGRSR
jgi:uncharacterized membrane protein